ncbi:MAG: hypothetical protein IJ047_01770 [Paludibacteraceae bacterium]|nr:hypothetical protein [Paludibacteraceae bacterium]
MAKVTWSAGIDHVSGALAKPSKSGQHSCAKMLLGTHRIAPSESQDCNRLYLRSKTKRSTQPSTKELKIRERFAAVAQMVTARRADLTKIVADQQAFLAQVNTAGGAKTMRAYLWRVCGQEYDQSNNG